MRCVYKYFIFLLLISAIGNIKAGQINIRAYIDTNQIFIGDQLYYTLEVIQSTGYHSIFPSLQDTLAKHIEIIDSTKIDTSHVQDGQLKLTKKYLITSFDSGMYIIPSYPFIFHTHNSKDTLHFPSVSLNVHTIAAVDTATGIKDIKPPFEAPVTFSEALPYLLYGILIAAIIIVFIYIISRRRKNRPVFRPHVPPKPAYIKALEELDKLKEEKLWQKNMLKEYYSRLTNIIRAYIEQRYSVKALEETTNEILQDMKKAGFRDKELFEQLRSLLSLADMVKFAKGITEPDENEQNMENAYTFVMRTKKKEGVENTGDNEDMNNQYQSNIINKQKGDVND